MTVCVDTYQLNCHQGLIPNGILDLRRHLCANQTFSSIQLTFLALFQMAFKHESNIQTSKLFRQHNSRLNSQESISIRSSNLDAIESKVHRTHTIDIYTWITTCGNEVSNDQVLTTWNGITTIVTIKLTIGLEPKLTLGPCG